MSGNTPRGEIVAIPKTRADLLKQRITKRHFDLNDRIDAVFQDNIDDPELQKYLTPIGDDESETGKCRYDDFKAAERIQQLAELAGDHGLANDIKTVTVMRHLSVVLRRYNMSRKQRWDAYVSAMSNDDTGTNG